MVFAAVFLVELVSSEGLGLAGLKVDLVVGLIVEFTGPVGLSVGFSVGLSAGLVVGLSAGLVVGFSAGLVVGLDVGFGVAGQFAEAQLFPPHASSDQSETSQGMLQASAPQAHPPVFVGNPDSRDMPLTVATETE